MTFTQKKASNPDEALELLKVGNQRFVSNLKLNRDYRFEIEVTKNGQNPFAVIVSCMDSRTSVELVFDQGIGDIFSIRLAGNVVTPEVIASCEFACHVVEASLILVLGHTGCGAINGAVNNVQLGNLSVILDRIRENISGLELVKEEDRLRIITEKNVQSGIHSLMTNSKVLKNLLTEKKVKIVGGIYDVTNGTVRFL